MEHMNRYHEKREKNNIAVKKFRGKQSVKDSEKMKQLELVLMMIRMMIRMMIKMMMIRKSVDYKI